MRPIERPRDELRRMLEQTLIPSPHVTVLNPDALEATTSRFASASGDISEQYQLASRLTALRVEEMVTPPGTASFVRQWQVETGGDGVEELLRMGSSQVRTVASLPAPLATCLKAYADVTPDLAPLFAADIVVSADGALWRLIGGTSHLIFEGDFDAADRLSVIAALESWPPDVEPAAPVFVFVVGVFARAALLARTRGYRNAVLSAGVLVGQMQTSWRSARRPGGARRTARCATWSTTSSRTPSWSSSRVRRRARSFRRATWTAAGPILSRSRCRPPPMSFPRGSPMRWTTGARRGTSATSRLRWRICRRSCTGRLGHEERKRVMGSRVSRSFAFRRSAGSAGCGSTCSSAGSMASPAVVTDTTR